MRCGSIYVRCELDSVKPEPAIRVLQSVFQGRYIVTADVVAAAAVSPDIEIVNVSVFGIGTETLTLTLTVTAIAMKACSDSPGEE